VSKNTQNPREKGEHSQKLEIKVTLLKIQKIMKENLIMHINISIQIEEIRTITTIKEIWIHLILIGQIRFILEVQMVGFMN
jgi:hypothetical protein